MIKIIGNWIKIGLRHWIKIGFRHWIKIGFKFEFSFVNICNVKQNTFKVIKSPLGDLQYLLLDVFKLFYNVIYSSKYTDHNLDHI